MSFPKSVVAAQTALPEGIPRVMLNDLSEAHLQQQLATIAVDYGPIAAFIHLHPAMPSEPNTQASDCLFAEAEAAIVKQVFFIAKHLKESLNRAAEQGRSCFLTVAHLDGELGLAGQINFGAIGGGLFGLTKALNREWSTVFCRAIDLSPELSASTSAQHILAELYDPNQLIAEVGYSTQRRTTTVC